MDVNDKVKYQKARYIVKKWESDFKNSKGSAPTKADIKSASKRVKDAYSSYWKLKAILLESSLLDATFDENAKDCFTLPPPSNISLKSSVQELVQDCVTSPPAGGPLLTKEKNQDISTLSFKSLLSSGEKNEVKNGAVTARQPLSPKKDVTNCDSVWGSHLSIRPPSTVRSMKEKSVSFQYSEKLFANAKFSKRNPRKTLRRNKTCDALPGCGESNSDVADVSLPDVSLPGAEPSSVPDISSATPLGEAPKAMPTSPIPHGFTINQDLGQSPSGHFDLLSEVKRVVIKEAPKVQYQSVSVVQALMRANTADSPSSERITRKLDPGWLGRLDSDSGIASSSGPGDCVSPNQDSGDELICHSDEESKSRFALTSSIVTRRSNLPISEASHTLAPENISVLPRQESGNKSSLNETIPLSKTTVLEESLAPVSSLSITLNNLKSIESNQVGAELSGSSSDAICNKRSQSNPLLRPSKRAKLESNSPAVLANRAVASKKQAALEKRVSSGVANSNFRRIDIKKKVYTRGKKGMNFSKYKKRQWKELKGLDNHGVIKCFKCGDVGHMAKQCKGVGELLPYEEYEEESIFPSLEEAAQAADRQAEHMPVRKIAALLPSQLSQKEDGSEAIPPDQSGSIETVEPLYSFQPDGSLRDTPEEVMDTLRELGHSEFLPGQEEAIMTVLSGRSCLVVMPTGAGKSLIYRLPALLYHRLRDGAITLVVSPLVSLMEDQVLSSESMTVGCLHHCQTEKQRKLVEERLVERQLSVLLVSPELLSSDGAMSLASKLPPVSFACIDEAHCLSHWSHNFRPSYLTLCRMLRERLKVKTLLGLTATVTAGTASSVVNALGGQDNVQLVKSDRFVPDNLVLSVSRDADRDSAILDLLEGSRFASCNSVIVYCTRRDECVRIAALLRTKLQSGGKNNGKSRLSPVAEVYHAGLTPSRRKQVQNAFMSGKTRIVVATVAFGMGINKRDLRGVIHYNMPATLENYLQEVGRAGRDGLPAHCHLFLSHAQSKDMCELKRHVYANSVDRCTLRRLLELASPQCKGCPHGKHEVAFPVESAVEQLDVAQEVVSTLIAYLGTCHLGFTLLPHAYTRARVSSYKGASHLASLAKQCGVLGVGLALARESSKVTSSAEFDVIKLADSVGWDSGIVKRTLKNLEWNKSEEGQWSRSGLNVEFSSLGFRLVAPCTLTPDQQDCALDLLHDRATSHETKSLQQLQFLYDSLRAVSYDRVEQCLDDIDLVKCEKLGASVRHYFTHPTALDQVVIKNEEVEDESEIRKSTRSLIGNEAVEEWTGRAVARIFHGIASPRYPALVWARSPFWRRHLDQPFPFVLRISSLALRDMRIP